MPVLHAFAWRWYSSLSLEATKTTAFEESTCHKESINNKIVTGFRQNTEVSIFCMD
jgi:hypothetical protein